MENKKNIVELNKILDSVDLVKIKMDFSTVLVKIKSNKEKIEFVANDFINCQKDKKRFIEICKEEKINILKYVNSLVKMTKLFLTKEEYKELSLKIDNMDKKDDFNTLKGLKIFKRVFSLYIEKVAPNLDHSEVLGLFDIYDGLKEFCYDNLKTFYNILIEETLFARYNDLDSTHYVFEFCFKLLWHFMDYKQKYPKAPISTIALFIEEGIKKDIENVKKLDKISYDINIEKGKKGALEKYGK